MIRKKKLRKEGTKCTIYPVFLHIKTNVVVRTFQIRDADPYWSKFSKGIWIEALPWPKKKCHYKKFFEIFGLWTFIKDFKAQVIAFSPTTR